VRRRRLGERERATVHVALSLLDESQDARDGLRHLRRGRGGRLPLERAEAEQTRKVLNEELARLEAERHALEDHNAQLQARQRELAEMHEQMADVWFESALSRARRHSAPPEPPAPVRRGGQGASP
jgi:hypothetical protein